MPGQDDIILTALQMPADKALEYLKGKGYEISGTTEELLENVRKNAFTITGVVKLDILADVRNSLALALEGKIDLKEFKENFVESLKKNGWYDEADRDKTLDTNWRMNFIFRENVNHLVQQGRYEGALDSQSRFPYLRFIDVRDKNETPRCRYKGTIKLAMRIDDPGLNNWHPLCHWGCRTDVMPVNLALMKSLGLKVKKASSLNQIHKNEEGFRTLPNVPFKPDLSGYNKGDSAQFKKSAKGQK